MVTARIQEIFSSTFVYRNEDWLDEDFRLLLQIFYFFGFFRSAPSTSRTTYGVLSIIFVVFTFLVGYFKDAVIALRENNLKNFMTSVPYTVIVLALLTQTITFMAKEKQIIKMVKAFNSMHDAKDDKLFDAYRKNCIHLVKIYIVFMELAVSMVLFFHFLGYMLYKLVSPTLLDDFVEGKLYIPLLITNSLQAYSVVTCMATSDLLHIFCMVRSGFNLERLCEKLRHCTDSEDLEDNERLLISCIKYHQRIIQ